MTDSETNYTEPLKEGAILFLLGVVAVSTTPYVLPLLPLPDAILNVIFPFIPVVSVGFIIAGVTVLAVTLAQYINPDKINSQ